MRLVHIAPLRPALAALAVVALVLTAATPAAAQPTNDDIAGAIVVGGLPFDDTGNTSDATPSSDDPDTCYSGGPTVWYALTLSADTRVVANTSGSQYDTTLAVFSGSPGSLWLIDCNDDFDGLQSRVVFDAFAGETYYFMISAFANEPGGYMEFHVREAGPPLEIDLQRELSARVKPKVGIVTLTGTVTCSRESSILLAATLSQRSGRATISGSDAAELACNGPTSWTLQVRSDNGRFAGGRASYVVYAEGFDNENGFFVTDTLEGTINVRGGAK